MILHTPITLPPLPQFSLTTHLPPSSTLTSQLTPSATISESSTRLSDLSGCALASGPPSFPSSFCTDVGTPLGGRSSPSFRDYSKPLSTDMMTTGMFDPHGAGYIPILPRTSSASGLFRKRCETCSTTHDGSFGAGRFCSSRCARTVGGLAHRKKRMLERGAKARQAAESRNKVKKARGLGVAREGGRFVRKGDTSKVVESQRCIMRIGALLNPCE